MDDSGKTPLSDDDITVDYLNSVLIGFKPIVQIDVRKPSTHGAVSNVRRVLIKYDEDSPGLAPPSIIIKYPIPVEESHFFKAGKPDMMRHAELYRHELRFYEVMKEIPLIPKVHHSRLQPNQDFVLIMEDCVDAGDLSMPPSANDENILFRNVSPARALVAVRNLAKFHAKFYHRGDRERFSESTNILSGTCDPVFVNAGLGWLPEYFAVVYFYVAFIHDGKGGPDEFAGYTDASMNFMAMEVQRSWDATCDYMIGLDYDELGYGDFKIPEKLATMKAFERPVAAFYAEFMNIMCKQAPVTVIHGDFRSDNILFVNGDERIKLVDWQSVSLGNGLVDIVTFLYSSMTPCDVTSMEDEVVSAYAKVLNGEGIDWFAVEEIRRCYRWALWRIFQGVCVHAKMVRAMNEGQMQIGCGYRAHYETMLKLIVSTVNDLHKFHYM